MDIQAEMSVEVKSVTVKKVDISSERLIQYGRKLITDNKSQSVKTNLILYHNSTNQGELVQHSFQIQGLA